MTPRLMRLPPGLVICFTHTYTPGPGIVVISIWRTGQIKLPFCRLFEGRLFVSDLKGCFGGR